MNDQLLSIAKQRGKVVTLFVILSFILGLVHPTSIVAVWGSAGVAVTAMASIEAFASKGAP
jgi:hypothetical protein